jgi:hypothetical protein
MEVVSGDVPVVEVAERYGVSRKTVVNSLAGSGRLARLRCWRSTSSPRCAGPRGPAIQRDSMVMAQAVADVSVSGSSMTGSSRRRIPGTKSPIQSVVPHNISATSASRLNSSLGICTRWPAKGPVL